MSLTPQNLKGAGGLGKRDLYRMQIHCERHLRPCGHGEDSKEHGVGLAHEIDQVLSARR